MVVRAVLWEVSRPWWERKLEARRARKALREAQGADYDPGRERRAEQRARELLKSCVNEEEWAMYRDLGFLRVWGGRSQGPDDTPDGDDLRGVPYAYLIYPHRPIVAYLPQTGRLLSEYCVEFPDESRPYGSPRLPAPEHVFPQRQAPPGEPAGAPPGRRGTGRPRGGHAPCGPGGRTRGPPPAPSGACVRGSATGSAASSA